MDSEDAVKKESAGSADDSVDSVGPYYHKSWWESYKGSVKGKLGGAVIGAIVGSIVAGLSVAILSTVMTGIPVALVFWGITAYGLKYGSEEFSGIGKVVGAIAAAEQIHESREAIRISVIEKKLDNLSGSIFSHYYRLKERELEKADTQQIRR